MTLLECTCMGIRYPRDSSYTHGTKNHSNSGRKGGREMGWVKSTTIKSHGLRIETQAFENSIGPVRNPSASSIDTCREVTYAESLFLVLGKGTIIASYKEVKGSMLVPQSVKVCFDILLYRRKTKYKGGRSFVDWKNCIWSLVEAKYVGWWWFVDEGWINVGWTMASGKREAVEPLIEAQCGAVWVKSVTIKSCSWKVTRSQDLLSVLHEIFLFL